MTERNIMRLYVNPNEVETLKKALAEYIPESENEFDHKCDLLSRVMRCEEMQKPTCKITITI